LHAPYRVLAGENISARFVVPTVAASVDLVIHLGIDRSLGVYSILMDGKVDLGPDQTEAVALAIMEQVRFLRLATA